MTTVNNIIDSTLHVTVVLRRQTLIRPVPTASGMKVVLAHDFVVVVGLHLPTDMPLSYLMMFYDDIVGIFTICIIQLASVDGGK